MRKGFTLIELLVVIAIIAILAVVVVLTLNPAQLLAQSRDANRLSDLATMNSAINLYSTDQSGVSSYSLGTPSTTFISVSDPAATSTAGTTCSAMGLPATSTNWSYHCAASSTVRSVTNTGWIPVNFSSISSGAPFSVLPVDPVNTTSSLLYYEYLTNGSQYELAVPLESQKYLKQELVIPDLDPARGILGSNSSLISPAEGLIGYWSLNEGGGSAAVDASGNGNNGAWLGSASGTAGYYSAGHNQAWAGYFNGVNTYIARGAQITNGWSQLSYIFWFNAASLSYSALVDEWAGPATFASVISYSTSGEFGVYLSTTGTSPGWSSVVTPAVTTGTWHQLAVTYDGVHEVVYLDGVQTFSTVATGNISPGGTDYFQIGAAANASHVPNDFFAGSIEAVRLYSRALSAAEVQAIYNAEK